MKQSIIAAMIVVAFSLSTVAEAAKGKGKSKTTTTPTASTATTTATTPVTPPTRTGSSKNEKHGDSGRALEAAEAQIKALEAQLYPGMDRAERVKINNKINNIRRTAQSKAKGEEHGRRGR